MVAAAAHGLWVQEQLQAVRQVQLGAELLTLGCSHCMLYCTGKR